MPANYGKKRGEMDLHSTFSFVSLFVAAFGFTLGVSAALADDHGRQGSDNIAGDETLEMQMTPTSAAAPGGSSRSTKLEIGNQELTQELKQPLIERRTDG